MDRFHRHWLPALLAGVAVYSASATSITAQEQPAAQRVDYLKDVKPLLSERCYACHGGLKQEGGLRLDTVALMQRGGESGPVVAGGDAAQSLILARVSTTDVAERMPPEHEGEPLTAAQVALLSEWISAGAAGPADERPEADPRDHWAFRLIVRPAVPRVRRTEWARNPIDCFVAAQHERLGLTPQPEAARSILLRRLTFDLIGLPPTAEEIAVVQNDPSPEWSARVVARLLEDPRHGERWARHWMDVWRYSDWWGLGDQLRNSQKHIWHWRDWIVESLNEDLPYDEMVRQMLAADELYPNDLDKLRATGYLARNYFLFNRHQWMDETVEHVSKGFLGLTMNCAKCHDHKYDPFSQTDYYRLRAFFEPYHVRMDLVPGEADLATNGVPRAFDGLLDEPTYRFVRGEESRPDKSNVIAPDVPALLQVAPLGIEPVELPPEAWQPELRPWVVEAHLAAARQRIASAEAQLAPAREKLAAAQRKEADLLATRNSPADATQAMVNSSPTGIIETFETLDEQRWKLFGGDWMHEPGRLEQKRDGATRSVLRLISAPPRDFEATLRFSILGGSQWRSVGIGFDCTEPDPSSPSGDDSSEQQVYVSAFAGGPKVQAAWQRGGQWRYPAEGMTPRPIELKRDYTLRLQVRDTLVNASLDGEPVIAWRSPLERRVGSFQVTTFDVLAVLHEVTLKPLSAEVTLREAGGPPSPQTPAGAAYAVAEARQELTIAELAVAAAKAEFHSIEQRGAASKADNSDKESAQGAARAEHEHAVARARLSLAQAELKLHRATDARDAVSRDIATARETLDKALQQAAEPGEQFTRLIGAQWTPTRFLSSGKDDPTVAFPPRSTGRRSALAAWITDPRNPLTARVAVNHIWMRHFGTPLIPTVFELGRKGTPPANPELVDWLAAELIDSGWSMKHLHRLIVESATYRMSSSAAGAESKLAKDPDNTYLWRRSASRLESQAVRDAILALAGTLDSTRGGRPVPPDRQAESRRRSLYFFHSNNERNLFLTMFDEALVKECYRREQSIVPQQALALTNSDLVLDASASIAGRLAEDLSTDDRADTSIFIRHAFIVLLGTEPGPAEMAASTRALAAWQKQPEAGQGDAATRFARSNLVWVLLNHNDFVTLR